MQIKGLTERFHIFIELIVQISFVFLRCTSGTNTTVSPQNVNVAEGSISVTLTCVSHLEVIQALSKHWMEWKIDNRIIVQNDTVFNTAKYRVNGNSYIPYISIVQNLTIYNMEITDTGDYACTLNSTSVGFITSISYANINVYRQITTPIMNDAIKLSPNLIVTEVGTNSIVFTCVSYLNVIETLFQHWIVWKKDYVVIVNNDTSLYPDKYTVQGASYIASINISQTLIIHNIVETDSGIFSCTIDSQYEYFLTTSSESQLIVDQKEKTTKVDSESINSRNDTNLIIFLSTGAILLLIILFGCTFLMCKIRPKNSSLKKVSEETETERRMSYYANIDVNDEEMKESPEPLSEQNNLNLETIPTTL